MTIRWGAQRAWLVGLGAALALGCGGSSSDPGGSGGAQGGGASDSGGSGGEHGLTCDAFCRAVATADCEGALSAASCSGICDALKRCTEWEAFASCAGPAPQLACSSGALSSSACQAPLRALSKCEPQGAGGSGAGGAGAGGSGAGAGGKACIGDGPDAETQGCSCPEGGFGVQRCVNGRFGACEGC